VVRGIFCICADGFTFLNILRLVEKIKERFRLALKNYFKFENPFSNPLLKHRSGAFLLQPTGVDTVEQRR
jgi:hypothetical protein